MCWYSISNEILALNFHSWTLRCGVYGLNLLKRSYCYVVKFLVQIMGHNPQVKVQNFYMKGDFGNTPRSLFIRYLGACMPQWQVLHVQHEVSIVGLRSSDSTGVRR